MEVSLYTYGHSDVFFERFGHTAIAIRDTLRKQDVAFNWGIFDFNQPSFLVRFLTGDTKYQMAGYATHQFNDAYRADNRSIRQQVLALTPVERGALAEFLAWNAREEHKYYRYDYYRDNCATRARDALDRVTQGRLHVALDTPGSGRTWRGETARLLGSMIPLYAGIEVALGRRADMPLTLWDEEFLPEHMATHYASLALPDVQGNKMRFVARDTMVFLSTRTPLPMEPPSRVPMATLIGFAVAGLIALLADAKGVAPRIALTAGVVLWYLVGGLLGTALLLAATVTKHVAYMGANTTLLLLQPLLLLAAIVVPIALYTRRSTATSRGIAMVCAALSVIAVIAQLVPSLQQSSGVVLAVVVPIDCAIAVAVLRLSASQS